VAACPDPASIPLPDGATSSRGIAEVIEPLGFADLASGACAYEVVSDDYNTGTILLIDPSAAKAEAFIDRAEELAIANGFTVDDSGRDGVQPSEIELKRIQGQNVDEGSTFDVSYFVDIPAELVDQFAPFGLSEGDSLVFAGLYFAVN